MSGVPSPEPPRVAMALLMGAAVGLGAVAGLWYVVRGVVDRVVDSWAKA